MKKPIPFGDYYLLDRINVGGMAEVFLAKKYGAESFERLVAIKRILPNIAEDSEFITMFIDEAKLAVTLNHANIAQIYELNKVGDAYFIALEYIHGKDLRAIWDRLRKKGEFMPPEMAAFVVHKICEGLDYAHRKKDTNGSDLNLVHRDVSPQNILVSYEGDLKLIDFGIAKAAKNTTKTQAGILKGKFGYMSPEQVRGLPIDRRSDIFAIGVVLYELVTGERLFAGTSDFSTLEKVRNVEIVPPKTYNKDIPDDIEEIILKALEKEPKNRFQWANEMSTSLQRFLFKSDKPYTTQDLAKFMKNFFAADIAREAKKLKMFDEMGVPQQAAQQAQQASAAAGQNPSTGSYSYGGTSATSPGTPIPAQPPPPAPIFDPNLMGDLQQHQAAQQQLPTKITTQSGARFSTPDSGSSHRTEPGATTPSPVRAPGGDLPTNPYQKMAGGKLVTPPAIVPQNIPNTSPRIVMPQNQPPKNSGIELALTNEEMKRERLKSTTKVDVTSGTARTATAGRGDVTGKHKAPKQVSTLYYGSQKTSSNKKLFIFIGLIIAALFVAVAFLVMTPTETTPTNETLVVPVGGGTISISVNPFDTKIFVDGREVAQKSPYKSTLLSPGKHKVELLRDGYKDVSEDVVVVAGEDTQRFFKLEPLVQEFGTVNVETFPSGATITLDGTPLLNTTPYKLENVVANTIHTLLLSMVGYKDLEKQFKVMTNETLPIKSRLEPSTVNVTIKSVPEGVAVFIEGKKEGDTPLVLKDVPCGKEVKAMLAKDGYKTYSIVIKPVGNECARGKQEVPVVQMERESKSGVIIDKNPIPQPAGDSDKKPGTLSVNSTPWAEVWVDGKKVSDQTPLMNFSLSAGPHKVRLYNEQLNVDKTFDIVIKSSENYPIMHKQ